MSLVVSLRLLFLAAALVVLGAAAPAAVRAQAPRPGLAVHPYFGLFDGGWAKIEGPDAAGAGFRAEFSDGGTFGVRASYGLTSHLALWAAGELDVHDEGPFLAGFGGVAGRYPVSERLRLEGRLGAGLLAEAPFGIVGVGAELFVFPWLSLDAAVELARPIGSTSRWNGQEQVPIRFEGGPNRVQIGIGIHPGF